MHNISNNLSFGASAITWFYAVVKKIVAMCVSLASPVQWACASAKTKQPLIINTTLFDLQGCHTEANLPAGGHSRIKIGPIGTRGPPGF